MSAMQKKQATKMKYLPIFVRFKELGKRPFKNGRFQKWLLYIITIWANLCI